MRARQSVLPWRSPDASPAESMIEGAGSICVAILWTMSWLFHAHHRDPGAIGQPDHLLAVDQEHLGAIDTERGRASLHHGLECRRPHRRDVETVVLGGTHRLHHDGARPGQAGAAADRLVGALDGLHG